MRPRRLVPTPSMGVALLALVVALGGTSYAALNLPAHSVGSAQLKPGAVTTRALHRGAVSTTRLGTGAVRKSNLGPDSVTGAKVNNGSLTAADFAAGSIPRGPAGAPGSAIAYGHVDDFSQLVPNQARGMTNANVTKGNDIGTFCFSGLPFVVHNAVANADSEDLGFIATVDVPHAPTAVSDCPANAQIEVTLWDGTHVQRKGGFFISIN